MKKIKKIIILVFPLLVFSISIYFIRNVNISEITCKSQYGECSSLIKEKLGSIGSCDVLKCKKNIDIVLSDVWTVEQYTYQFKLPFKIEINLIERKPKYSIKSVSNNLAVQLDSQGLVLDIKESTSLPGFLTEGTLPGLGERVTNEEHFALQLVYGTSKIQDVESARFEKSFLSVDLVGGEKVLFPLSGDRDFILGALTLILNRLKKDNPDPTIEGKQIEMIDLRYKNPVLK